MLALLQLLQICATMLTSVTELQAMAHINKFEVFCWSATVPPFNVSCKYHLND